MVIGYRVPREIPALTPSLPSTVRSSKLTPAIKLLEKRKIEHCVHQYEHDRDAKSYGMEAVQKLGVDQARVFKTLVAAATLNKGSAQLVTAMVPVAAQLDLKALARISAAKRAVMADPDLVARSSGYVLGGVSPLGQKKRLPSYLDESARDLATIYVSAGKRGLEIELAPQALLDLLDGQFASITHDGK